MDRADWCFISGVVAASETRLLGHEELVELLRGGSAATMVSRLRQSEVYRQVGVEEGAEGLSGRIELAVIKALREAGKMSPDARAVELVLSPYDHQQVRNYIKAQVQGHAFEGSRFSELVEAELRGAWEDSYGAEERWAGVCRSVRRELAAGGDADVVIDLVIDHDELAGLLELARGLESEFIERCYAEYTSARARLAMVRARLAGLDGEQVRRLGTGLLDEGEVNELAELPMERLGHRLGADRAGQGRVAEGLARLALEIDNTMTERARDAKGFAFGPEPVFGYAWGLWVECMNLKLISETKLLGAPAASTEWRLRKTYV